MERTKEEILADLAAKMRNRPPVCQTQETNPPAPPTPAPEPKARKIRKKETAPRTSKVDYPPRFCDKCGLEYVPKIKTQRYCDNCRRCIPPERTKGDKSGIVTCAICGKEFEAKNAELAKYCSKECSSKIYSKENRDKKPEPISDNQKMVWVQCVNPECPNGNKFHTTYQKYRSGAKFCDIHCRDTYKRLNSKKFQREQEEKRHNPPEQVVQVDYEPHPAQMEFHNSNARFKTLVCGARFGKDRACIQEFIRDFADMLSEKRPTSNVPRVLGWLVAPSFPLARQLWREIKEYFPKQWIVSKNEAELKIDTVAGGIIEVKSASDPDSLVAVGCDIVLLSEFSRVAKKQEVWSYILGRTSSPHRGPGGKGGKVLINSTPKGKDLFYDMFLWGQSKDPENADWDSWQFPTVANPHFDPKNLEIAKRTMPDRLFRQEFLAEFLSDSGDVFIGIDDVSTGFYQEPEPGVAYFAAMDPAEKGDFSCFTIINSRGEQVFLKRWTGVPYSIQINEVEYYCKKYNHASVTIDCTAAGSSTLVQALIQRGVAAQEAIFSNQSKSQWVSHFAILCENKEIILLSPKVNDDTRTQLEELKAYTYTYTATKKISYHHSSGQHDDCVDALLLAYKDFHSAVATLPFIGILLGSRMGYQDQPGRR